MAEICCDVVSESEASTPCERSSRKARRRRMEIRRFKCVAVSTSESENEEKRQKLELQTTAVSREWCNAVESGAVVGEERLLDTVNERSEMKETSVSTQPEIILTPSASLSAALLYPKVGMASVCGRRRDMEDAVAIRPFFRRRENETASELHYYAVYDGHGCSHVATSCRDRLHELVEEELENEDASTEWKSVMSRSFHRMDREAIEWNQSVIGANCRCELQTPEGDGVGSTAVVAIVTPEKIIVANCGDSRAVLCRNGKPVPLSVDHKPDRPDELSRIQAAGGRVIYWDGPRVLGVLAMSRAIGDNYLKPYVSCEPEVTVTDRTADDDCLILASDGLWDVVSNETACGVARMCLGAADDRGSPKRDGCGENEDKACSDASILLTKLALARRSSDNVSVVVIDLGRG